MGYTTPFISVLPTHLWFREVKLVNDINEILIQGADARSPRVHSYPGEFQCSRPTPRLLILLKDHNVHFRKLLLQIISCPATAHTTTDDCHSRCAALNPLSQACDNKNWQKHPYQPATLGGCCHPHLVPVARAKQPDHSR
eukprot:1180314-Prorocentrum_minimum.AAC.7